MPENGVTKDEVIEIVRSLEAKIYSVGMQLRWLGIGLFLFGAFVAILGAGSWGLVTLVAGFTLMVVGSIIQHFFGPQTENE